MAPSRLPAFVPLMDQVLVVLGPTSVFVPPPPVNVPERLPPAAILNVLLSLPPVRFWIEENRKAPKRAPALVPKMDQVLVVPGPTSVLVPPPPANVPERL